MNDDERFERVLTELGRLLGAMGDLARHVVLIGGQVPSLLARQRQGRGPLQVRTQTGVTITRPFSLEPDLLFDVANSGFLADRLPEVLRAQGFERTDRSYRWRKIVDGLSVEIDLFAPPDTEPPTPMTRLSSADLVLCRPDRLRLATAEGSFEIAVPSAAAYLATKLEARTLRSNPRDRWKDSFDLYAYVWLVGTQGIDQALDRLREGRDLREALVKLFGTPKSEGTLEVVEFAGSLSSEEGELLARAVADLFEPLLLR
jgi:hypothetical protein